MARRQQPEQSSGGGIIIAVVILLLLAFVIAAGIYFWKQEQAPQLATTPPTSQQAPPISDDRILFGGMPEPRNPAVAFTVLKNSAYIVGYSEKRKDPLWSAYRVKHMDRPFVLERPKGEFLTDDRTTARVNHHDFTGSGFDRGHMTPNSAIARCYGEEAQKQTFLLSNICPQAPALNQKVWEHLEMREITYADEYSEVWVVDGPIFGDQLNPRGTTRTLRAGISVPAAFYKICLEDHADTPRVFAIIMPQTVKGTESPEQFLVSVSEIETDTGLTFFPQLDPATRERLESQVFPMW